MCCSCGDGRIKDEASVTLRGYTDSACSPSPSTLSFLLLWTTSKKEKSPMGMEGKVTKQEDDVCWQPKED